MKKKLAKVINDKLSILLRSAEQAGLQKKFIKAESFYLEALTILPSPANQWEEALDIYMNFGEILFLQKKYDEAAKCFGEATKVPNGLGYPWLHLRLGQIRFEQGYLEKAKDELMRAYMGEGEEIFEVVDKKYIDLIRPLIKGK